MTLPTPLLALAAVALVLFFGWALGRAIDHEMGSSCAQVITLETVCSAPKP